MVTGKSHLDEQLRSEVQKSAIKFDFPSPHWIKWTQLSLMATQLSQLELSGNMAGWKY